MYPKQSAKRKRGESTDDSDFGTEEDRHAHEETHRKRLRQEPGKNELMKQLHEKQAALDSQRQKEVEEGEKQAIALVSGQDGQSMQELVDAQKRAERQAEEKRVLL